MAQVATGSPAEKAGLKAGDVITAVNDKPVRNSADVRNIIGLLRVGEKVKMDVLREGKARSLAATIDEPQMVALDGKRLHPRLAGALYGNIEEGSPLFGHVEGVLVAKVQPGGPAWRAGLRPGDVITSVNRQPLADVQALQHLATPGTRVLLLNVQRGDGALFILIQ